jgi:hypothetical protein
MCLLRGELGEIILAFDHNIQTMRGLSFLDVVSPRHGARSTWRDCSPRYLSVDEVVETMLNDWYSSRSALSRSVVRAGQHHGLQLQVPEQCLAGAPFRRSIIPRPAM